MRTGRPRTFDIRKDDLTRMRSAGLGRIMIAKVYGCHETTIRHWLIKFDLPTALPKRKPDRARMRRLIEASRRGRMMFRYPQDDVPVVPDTSE